MKIAEVITRMIDYSKGNLHDINHFMKVWGFAKTIGEQEQLDEKMQYILELAAIVHDIACPLCREKYGNTNGKYQEIEGEVLAKEFLNGCVIEPEIVDRVAYLVAHHHTINEIDSVDYQILIEADYIVNADESGYFKQNIENFRESVFKTKTGIELLNSIYVL